jgi:calcium-dependent protein kinase
MLINLMGCGHVLCSSGKSRQSRKIRASLEISPTKSLNAAKVHSKDTRHLLYDDYVSVDCLGLGAFSEVVLNLHLPSQESRALKIISKQLLSSQHLDNIYLIKEMAILECLSHEKIIKAYEIFEDKNSYYLVMQYCKGGNLGKRLKKVGRFEEKDAKQIMYQLLLALDHCHNKGVIHRDVKAENVLFEEEEGLNIKLADFGSSCFKSLVGTAHGIFGTPYYMAPEMFESHYDEKVDSWSCGILLYVMLTANVPYSGLNLNEIRAKMKVLPFQVTESELKGVSQQGIEFIEMMLKIEPSARMSAGHALEHPWLAEVKKT